MGLTRSLCQLQEAVVLIEQDVPESRVFLMLREMAVLISFLNSTVQSMEASVFWITQKVWIPVFFQAHTLCYIIGWDFWCSSKQLCLSWILLTQYKGL